MPEYRAREGQEDRHGEMTGAISINMVLSMLPVTIYSIWLAPLCFENMTWRVVSCVALAVILPLAFFRPSRWIWAWISEYMEGDAFTPRQISNDIPDGKRRE